MITNTRATHTTMDASNPVMSVDRVKLANLAQEVGVRRRQDLRYLEKLTETARRVHVAGAPTQPSNNFELFVKACEALGKTPSTGLDGTPLPFLRPLDPVPVDNVQHAGAQIHPPKIHMKDGYVTTQRKFHGATGYDPLIARGVAAHVPWEEMSQAFNKYTHSYGSPTGFVKRLEELTARKCVSPLNEKQVMEKLEKLLPIDPETLPDWNDIDSLLQNVELTHSASAGAPYWKSKRDAYYQCIETILPEVMDAFGATDAPGSVLALEDRHPEWFLCEIKNKLDRYETDRMDDKCRPYVAQPMHFSILFSALVQPFCKALKLWDKDKTYNAYGMSAMNGGLTRLTQKMRGMRDKTQSDGQTRYMVGCYGDDGKIVEFKKVGQHVTVTSVDPDFRQMDGSVDYATVRGTCLYIYRAFSRKWGPHPFWQNILSYMAIMATHPKFIIDGTQVYGKIQKDGILSGAVGTTLFDTAKAAIAYDSVVSSLKFGSLTMMNGARVAKKLLDDHGLEVKTGTWMPTSVDLDREREHVTETKFLGVHWKTVERPDGTHVVVPSLPLDDWLALALTPRDNPGDGRLSHTSSQRRSFDRARGLLVTGAIFDPVMSECLLATIDMVPSMPIVMSVQAGGGTGEVLSENNILTQDLVYPSASGYPTLEWTLDLYAEHKEKTKMPEIFPTILKQLNWSQRVAGYKIMMRGAQPGLDIDTPVTPRAAVMPGRDLSLSYRKALVRTAPPPVPPRQKLQTEAEYLSSQVMTGVLPVTHLKAVTVASNAVRTAHKGPVVDLFSKNETDESVEQLLLSLVTPRIFERAPNQNPLHYIHAFADNNDVRLEFDEETTHHEGLSYNRVFLRVTDPQNPFIDRTLARAKGNASRDFLRSLIATQVTSALERMRHALKGRCPPPPQPPHTVNPFTKRLNERRSKGRVTIPHPPKKADELYNESPDFLWSESVALHQEGNLMVIPPEKSDLEALKAQIKEKFTTHYERMLAETNPRKKSNLKLGLRRKIQNETAKTRPENRCIPESHSLSSETDRQTPTGSTKQERRQRRKAAVSARRSGAPTVAALFGQLSTIWD